VGYLKQLAGQTFIYGLGIVIPRLMNYLLLTPFYTRIFSSNQYGVVTELYAYMVFLLVILTYGMETGFFRFADKKHNKDDVYKTSVITLLTTSLLFLALVLLNQNGIAKLLKYPSNPEYIRWIAVIACIDAFTAIPFAKLRLQNKALKYAVIRIAEVVMNIFFNWFFLYYCPNNCSEVSFINTVYNPDIGVGYVFISNLIASGLKLILLIPDFIIIKGKIDAGLARKMLHYSYPLLIAGLAGTINEALDRILLKHILRENALSQLGIYGANYKLAVLMTLFVQMFRYAAEPFFFNQKDIRNAKEIYAEIMIYFVFVGMGIFLLVMIFLDYFVLFIGKDFREGIGIVPIILMANLFMGIFYNLSIWYKLTGQTKYGAWFVFAGALITIAINIIFVPVYGYYASAWGHFFSYLIMILVCLYYGNRNYYIPYHYRRLILLIVVPLLLLFLNRIIEFENSALNIISGLIFMFLYVVFFLKIQKINVAKIWK